MKPSENFFYNVETLERMSRESIRREGYKAAVRLTCPTCQYTIHCMEWVKVGTYRCPGCQVEWPVSQLSEGYVRGEKVPISQETENEKH